MRYLYIAIPGAVTRKCHFLLQHKVRGKVGPLPKRRFLPLSAPFLATADRAGAGPQRQDAKADGAGEGRDTWEIADY